MNIPRFQSPDDNISKADLEVEQISHYYWHKQGLIALESGILLKTAPDIDQYLEAQKRAKEKDNGLDNARTS